MNQQSNMQSVSMHRRIAESISTQIKNGELQQGDKLPAERKIATLFSASRGTVRTALVNLEQAGLITRRDRRHAVVSIKQKQHVTSKIACSSIEIINLLHNLGDLQILPPGYQLQYTDLYQPEAFNRMVSQPTLLPDILVCDFEHFGLFNHNGAYHLQMPCSDFTDIRLPAAIKTMFTNQNHYQAIPLGLSPMVLYGNRAIIEEVQPTLLPPQFTWQAFTETLDLLVNSAPYCLQIRPTFKHLNTLFNCFNTSLYDRHGSTSIPHDSNRKAALDFLDKYLHQRQGIPKLTRVDQLNLFSQQRCAFSIDGFEKYHQYKKALGDDLVVYSLSHLQTSGTVVDGFCAVVLSNSSGDQGSSDLVKTLLNLSPQRVMMQSGATISVRKELQNDESFFNADILPHHTRPFMETLINCSMPSLAQSPHYKASVESLLLEFWLQLSPKEQIIDRINNI